jgi:hypothetical protein
MIVMLAVVDVVVVIIVVIVVIIIVIIIVIVVGTNNGIEFFTKFKVSTNIGKIRVTLNRERSGR